MKEARSIGHGIFSISTRFAYRVISRGAVDLESSASRMVG